MKVLVILASFLFLGACAHHGHHGHHKSKCGSKCSKKWEKMDTNKDGKVSKDEFMSGKQEKFAKMDVNKDGFITKEDREAAKKDCKSCK